jgi:hypothetical protein
MNDGTGSIRIMLVSLAYYVNLICVTNRCSSLSLVSDLVGGAATHIYYRGSDLTRQLRGDPRHDDV